MSTESTQYILRAGWSKKSKKELIDEIIAAKVELAQLRYFNEQKHKIEDRHNWHKYYDEKAIESSEYLKKWENAESRVIDLEHRDRLYKILFVSSLALCCVGVFGTL